MDNNENTVHGENIQPEEAVFENPTENVLEEQTAYVEPIREEPRTSNFSRKKSPYADSPYIWESEPPYQKAVSQKRKKQHNTKGIWKRALSITAAIALLAGACIATAFAVDYRWEKKLESVEAHANDRYEELLKKIENVNNSFGGSVSGSPVASAEGGLTPAQVYTRNVNSVVLVHNEVTANVQGQISTGVSTGSGFILTEDGYVVTNYHVVEGNGTLSVVTTDSKEYTAKLVGFDETNDVALLKVESTGLQAVILGSSDELIVGDQVVAIGNPLGELTSTLTVGYISAKERDVNTSGFAINMLQTDAAINSGNSGGPLFNMKGEVVGITTAKYSGTSSSGASIEGVGFAIPIDDVRNLLSDLATYGYVTGAYLGVSVSDMDAAAAAYYGMPVGAYVQKVEAGYAAEKAGVCPKDIIVALGDIEVETVNDLTRALRNFKAGDSTVITLYRGGQKMQVTIVLDEKPTESSSDMPEGNFDDWYDYLAPFFGGNG